LRWQRGENDDNGKRTMANVSTQWQSGKRNEEKDNNGKEITMVKGRE
jgi:hypothetical protein